MALTPLQWGFFSFLIGVFCADAFREYSVLSMSILFFIFAFLPLLQRVWYIFFGILGFFIGFFFLWFQIPDITKTPLYEVAKNEESIKALGFITSFPIQKENKTQFEVIITSFSSDRFPDTKNHIHQKILVSQFGVHEWKYGESVSIEGKIILPKPFDGFLYDRFLAKDQIYAVMHSAYAVHSSEKYIFSAWQQFWIKAFSFRESFEQNIRSTIAFPESEYALGIVMGSEAGIPSEILQDFTASGLRHLLALSGFNITIILLVVFSLFVFLPIWVRIIISLLLVAFFVGITGSSASVVRAAVMGGVGMVLLYMGRRQNPLWIVVFSLCGITLYNPFLLFSDPSLHLSVLAVLGLIFYLPILKNNKVLFSWMPPLLAEVMMATIAAQIFTIPYMAFSFGTISWVSFFSNLLVVPITAFAMLFSFLCAIPFIGVFAMPFAYILLHFSIFIAHLFAHLPYAQISIMPFSPWHLLWIYSLLVWLVYRIK